MKLGMPTLIEFSSLEENIKLCNRLGLDFIELNMDLPYCMPNNIDWKQIKKNSNVEFTVHLSEKLEVGEIYEYARKKQIEIIKNAINYYKRNADIKKYLNFCEKNNIYAVIEVKKQQELINSINYINKLKMI